MTNKQSYINEIIEHYKTLLPQEKYNHPGVYSITIDGEIVYIGKARNMLNRVATHMYMIKDAYLKTEGEKFKYGELRRALRNDYTINFDVIYSSPVSINADKNIIDDDIGPEEAKYINAHKPKLNRQIPYLDNYHSYYNKPYEVLNIKEKFFNG